MTLQSPSEESTQSITQGEKKMDKQREDFEKLATERGMNIRRSLVDPGDYMTEGTKDAWAAYQAALASLQPAQPVAWMRHDHTMCITDDSKRQMENTDFGHWKEVAASYTIPLAFAASPLPQSALSTDAQKVREQALLDALQRLESANNTLCSMRTQAMYDSMLDAGQQDALIELDNARFAARAIIRALQSQSLPSAEDVDYAEIVKRYEDAGDHENAAIIRRQWEVAIAHKENG